MTPVQGYSAKKHYDTSPESDANNIFHLFCNPDLIVVCLLDTSPGKSEYNTANLEI